MSDASGNSVNTGTSAAEGTGGTSAGGGTGGTSAGGGTGDTPSGLLASITLQSGIMDGEQGQEGFGSGNELELEGERGRVREREGGGERVSTGGDIEREGEVSREWLMREREGGAYSESGSQETDQLSGSSIAVAGGGIAGPSSSAIFVQMEARTAVALSSASGSGTGGSGVLTVPMVDDETVTEMDSGSMAEGETEGEGERERETEALLIESQSETETESGMSVPSGNTATYSVDMATADSTVTAADGGSVADRLAAIQVASLSRDDLYSAADETDDAYLPSLNYSFVSFISFPFVLSSSSKAAVLECDATQQMRRGKSFASATLPLY